MTMYTESLRAFLKPVIPYLDDDSVSEIMINGPEDVWTERKDRLTIDALLKLGSMTPQMARLIEAGIHTRLNMVVAGGTGSGKPTLLNIVSSLIPDDERILTIEDCAELQLNQTHLVPFESRPQD